MNEKCEQKILTKAKQHINKQEIRNKVTIFVYSAVNIAKRFSRQRICEESKGVIGTKMFSKN